MSITSDLNHFSCKESLLTGRQHPPGCGMLLANGAVTQQALAGQHPGQPRSWIHVWGHVEPAPAPAGSLMSEHSCTAAMIFASK